MKLVLALIMGASLLQPVEAHAKAERLRPQETTSIAAATVKVTPARRRDPVVHRAATSEEPKGKAGDFTATSLSPASTWTGGGASGGFSWSYPLRTPPGLGALAPKVQLAYSSQAVDGRTLATNNQPSWIGEGFDFWPGFIERKYKACADDLGGNNEQRKTGDLCWGTENLTLSLNGSATELIKGSDGKWHGRQDDGARIESYGVGGNGDDNGEAWKVTTTDGTQYFFGTRPAAGSVWTVPVFGNHAGEPCRKDAFDASWCAQAWRWNLDYVADVHGNTMTYVYAKETNHYGRNLDAAKATPYTRGGWLQRIEYGSRTDTTGAPARVVFDVADRCLSNCGNHGTNWPDVPWDKECAEAPCKDKWSPTFWTTKRLAKVTTQVWGGSAYRDADSWTLRHTFPDPGDNTKAALWLAGITHTGLFGGSQSMPEITLEGTAMNNRVDGVDHSAPMNWYRLTRIGTESGGEISIKYKEPECVIGGLMPASPASNTLRCFPVYWTPEGKTDPLLDWFHKYVVETVTETDRVGGAPRVLTAYEYLGGGAWRHADADGLSKPEHNTWSQWRGYGTVRVRKGDPGQQTLTETLYYRGMNGDLLPGGGRRSVSVADNDGGTAADEDHFSGMARESLTKDAETGAVVTATVSTAWRSAPTAGRTIGKDTVEARRVAVAQTRTRVALDGGRGWRRTKSVTTFDEYGMPSAEDDFGDESTPGDDRCAKTTYARNPGLWLLTPVKRVEKYALSCDKQAGAEEHVLEDTRTSFDGNAYDAAPTRGLATQVEKAKTWSAGGPSYLVTTRTAYDAYGRVTTTWDAMGAKTTTAYTPATGGPLTKTVVTNPLGFTETAEMEPARGAKTAMIDANDKRTDIGYDPLGRTAAVWLPGRAKATQTPNLAFEYIVRASGANAVKTTKLLPDGTRSTSYVLHDSLLRARQTQEPAVGGGRVITDTYYDSAGRVIKTNGKWFNDEAAPGDTIVAPLGGIDNQIPAQTVTAYDGAGRKSAEIVRSFGEEQWRTTTGYGGDRTDVTPPAGGVATSTVVDARDQTVELRQYHGPAPLGAFDRTTYTYDGGGRLTSLTDPAGNVWRHGYDLRGRKIRSDDPDKGGSITTYDDADRPVTVTDSRGVTLTTAYDELGRKKTLSSGGSKLAEWTYDSLAKGQLTSSTRWDGAAAHTVAVRGYTARNLPTGTVVTAPGMGTFTTKATYHVDGSPATTTLPAAGGLPEETLTTAYNEIGLPKTLGGLSTYVTGTDYTRFGEPTVITMKQVTMTESGPESGPYTQRGLYYDEVTRQPNRIVALRETGPSYLSDASFTRDPAGNITKIADTRQADTQCFRHDYLRRLTAAWTPASGNCADTAIGGPAPYTQSWTFDLVGNRLTQTDNGTTTVSTYPPAGGPQPHTLLKAGAQTYTYDRAGNTLTRPGQNLDWDAEGRLAKLTENGKATTFVYDADGARLLRRDPAGTTLYLGGMELRKDTATGAVKATRYYSHGGSTIAMRDATGVTWLLSDHQGTAAVAVTASDTQPFVLRRQTPYGGQRGEAAAWPGEKGFVGGTRDPSGLTHLGAREYDPTLGRFLSLDPVMDPKDPQQMHGYAYSNNTPVTASDPDGLWCNGPDGMCKGKDGQWKEETGIGYQEAQRERQWMIHHAQRGGVFLQITVREMGPKIFEYAHRAGIDPRLLMAVVSIELADTLPVTDDVKCRFDFSDAGCSRGATMIKKDAWDGVVKKHAKEFEGRSWEDLSSDPELAVKATAWILRDRLDAIPEDHKLDKRNYSREQIAAIGYNVGEKNLRDTLAGDNSRSGDSVGPKARAYLRRFEPQYKAVNDVFCRMGYSQCTR